MSPALKLFLITTAIVSLVAVSCTKKKDPVTPPDDTTSVPQGIARITGTVKDASGAALSDVALHVVYDINPARPLARPMVPSSVLFYNIDQTLTTECSGTTPIPDGVMVKLFWDSTGNGADENDPQPRVCFDPPDCNSGPPLTVNLNEFPINGAANPEDVGPGRFYMERNFVTVGDAFTPSRFFARIYCADGNVLWESDVVTVDQGASEVELNFHCTPCEGEPGVPQWSLEQPYPNPATDSVTVKIGLRESAQALLTLHWPNSQRTDTTFYQSAGSGTRNVTFLLGNRPNGLYTVRLQAGTFQSQMPLLKNVSDNERLRGTDAAAFTAGDGAYRLDAAAGVTINRRGHGGDILGTAPLNQIKIVAIKVGYAIAETTLAVTGQQEYPVNLTLRP